jgi:eukaryotic-like serine/threonine-protein kinase
MINQTVGNYRILKLLGEGGMGAVYLAEHPGIGRKAAVKVLHPGMAQNEEVVTRFFNEARAANAVKHPGIVEIFDFGTLPTGATYIIMEFLEGESLAARIRRSGRIRIGDAVEFAYQTAAVLGAAHEKGIVHRDLKPDNLFLIPDTHTPGREMVKVLDFGIAKLNAGAGGSGSVKTRTGTVMGTPLYMSPEQCRGNKEVDHRTDIYALGIILYEMLCGDPPFVSEGHGELIHMHIGTPPAPPRTHNPGIPQDLERVVLKALAKDPGQRFATMGDVQQALRGAQARTVSAPQVDPVAPTPRAPRSDPPQTTFTAAASMIENQITQRRRSKWAAPAIGLVVAAAIVVGGVYLTGGKQTGAPGSGASSTAAPESASLGTTSPATTTPATAPGAPPAPAEAAKPAAPGSTAMIMIGITSDPPGARVVREKDGADLGITPFKDSWPVKDGAEKLRIELDGYRHEPLVVPLDRSADLAFTLKKIAAPAPHKKKPHDGSSRTVAPRAAPASPVPTAPKSTPRPEPVPL